jgi:hypothetical protein
LESVGTMAEVLDPADLSISDRAQLEEVDDDRDAALSASATLANESQDPTTRRIDQLKRLGEQVRFTIAPRSLAGLTRVAAGRDEIYVRRLRESRLIERIGLPRRTGRAQPE